MRPRQVSVLACVILAGTSEGLAGLRVHKGARCRCCSTERSCEIVYSENPSNVEDGDVEQVCSNPETILLCL